MDKFTEAANKVINQINEKKLIYTSEPGDAPPEEDAESSDMTMVGGENLAGLDPKTIRTINVARQLSTSPKKRMFGRDPQKIMDQAYGKLITKVAGAIDKASNKI